MLGSIDKVREIEIVDVVAGENVRIHFSHKLGPFLEMNK